MEAPAFNAADTDASAEAPAEALIEAEADSPNPLF